MGNDPEIQKILNALVIRTVSQLQEGISKTEAISLLEKSGISPDLAQHITNSAEMVINAGKKKQASTTLMVGIGLFGLGLAITLGSYNSAVENGGGHYTIAIGMMGGGAIMVLKNLWKSIAG